MQHALEVDGVGLDDDFTALGGDSILAMQVSARLRAAGLAVGPADVMRVRTVAAIAELLTDALPAGTAEPAGPAAPDSSATLTPIQRWFLDLDHPRTARIDQYALLELAGPADRADLDRLFAALLDRHPLLRSRFLADPDGRYTGFEAVPLPAGDLVSEVDLAGLTGDGQHAAARELAWQWEGDWRLDAAPQLRAALLRRGTDRPWLLLAASHLVVDQVSWRVILTDLATFAGGRIPDRVGASYAQLCAALDRYAASDRAAAQLAYWAGVCAGATTGLPRELDDGPDDEVSCASVAVELDEADTARVLAASPGPLAVLLAAFGLALEGWARPGELVVDVLGHGRMLPFATHLDLSHTVGWCSTRYPVVVPTGPGDGAARLAEVTRRLAEVPDDGHGYGALYHLAGHHSLRSPASVAVNYVGQVGRGVTGTDLARPVEPAVPVRATPQAPNAYRIWLQAGVVAGRLRLSLRYSRNRHHAASVQALADRLHHRLTELTRPH